jgi:hypothetical protein
MHFQKGETEFGPVLASSGYEAHFPAGSGSVFEVCRLEVQNFVETGSRSGLHHISIILWLKFIYIKDVSTCYLIDIGTCVV